MAKAKALTPKRAPGSPGAEPALVKKVVRKKNKRFGGRKRRNVSQKPENDPRLVVVRPPKAPEDFSPNWKALQEYLWWTGRGQRLPQRPSGQSTAAQEPRKGCTVTWLPGEGPSSTRSGKLRRQPQPWHQPCPLREDFEVVQKEVANILKGRILVGHALHNDLKVLFLDHPKKKIRDTQKYKPFKSQVKSGRPSLKLLAEQILGIRVQQAEHCSIQDAQAAMRLYIMAKKQWESMAQGRRTRLQPAAVSELTAPASNNGSVSVHRQL
ncbi:RNA exonuclease 4 isoform X3 [Manis javanica]|uniref:RNA exonuclease 4 isoform X3 n=1 Tax=Manis javanica TaxID=9974 RepID=UPI003C6D4C17